MSRAGEISCGQRPTGSVRRGWPGGRHWRRTRTSTRYVVRPATSPSVSFAKVFSVVGTPILHPSSSPRLSLFSMEVAGVGAGATSPLNRWIDSAVPRCASVRYSRHAQHVVCGTETCSRSWHKRAASISISPRRVTCTKGSNSTRCVRVRYPPQERTRPIGWAFIFETQTVC